MSLLTILAEVTVSDGIGMDDLTWLAGLIAAVTDVLWTLLAGSVLLATLLAAWSARTGRLAAWKAAQQTPGDGRTLPWRVFGRAVKPYAFAVSLATSVSVWSVATDRAVGLLLDGLPGAVIAAYGVIAVGALWAGFWGRRDGWMRGGLLASAGYWAAVGAVIILEPGVALISGWLAWCWALASGAAWLLEEIDVRRRR